MELGVGVHRKEAGDLSWAGALSLELGIGLELRLQGSRGVDCYGVGDGGGTWGQGELAQGQRADFGGTERSGGGVQTSFRRHLMAVGRNSVYEG